MNKYALILLALLSLDSFLAQADAPKPPLGKRWVLNPNFSDEFNGTSLDSTKWYNYHPTWKGREPGIFLSSQVSVKDGFLQIKAEKLKKDTIINNRVFNIAGGAVVSKNKAYLGYYESRIKASETTMSATFWFSSHRGNKGPDGCDSYGLEWDIQECIGRSGDFKGKFFAYGMHSNAHFWYKGCEKKLEDLRAPDVRFQDTELASANFHVYGGWWHDETMASYYYDNQEPKYQKFYDKIKSKPFDQPMYMRLVCETYPFPWIELPTDEELADDNKNTVYYDWVRGYRLIDVGEENPYNKVLENSLKLYRESISFEGASFDYAKAESIKIPLTYQANKDREIHLILKNSEGVRVADQVFTVLAGYGYLETDFKIAEVPAAEAYNLEGYIRPIGKTRRYRIDHSNLRLNLYPAKEPETKSKNKKKKN
ncbi:family 16 glycosylhydrolase [Reichenbachiella versicolor]|uniref:family 16 glycosylhydrolase n=1 Tax=Reichenbachiella versicolor TaxID=1821036 RepID=UPI001C888DB7|nr:family 16 glycosylhydrolase [Reichenbachiella versicolor]